MKRLLLSLGFLFILTFAQAQYCRLDSTFASVGYTRVDTLVKFARTLSQPDSKILVLTQYVGDSLFMYRFLPTGALDPTFGLAGKTKIVGLLGSSYVLTDFLLQPDGKIVASGFSSSANNSAVFRLLSNGQPDNSFGQAGRAYLDTTLTINRYITDLAIQPDGKLLLACPGLHYTGVTRLLPSGVTDTAFGTNGSSYYYFENRPYVNFVPDTFVQIQHVGVQSNGKIIVGGSLEYYVANPIGTAYRAYATNIVRFLSDGSLDTTFSLHGSLVPDFHADDNTNQDMIIDRDDKILFIGQHTFPSPIYLTVVINSFRAERYTSDGFLDPAYGNGGKAVEPVFSSVYNAARTVEKMVLDSQNRLVVVCQTTDSARSLVLPFVFAIARLTPSGQPDQTFGRGGTVFSASRHLTVSGSGSGICLQPDGKIILTGSYANNSGGGPLQVARYGFDGPMPDSLVTEYIDGPLCGYHYINVAYTTYAKFQSGNIFTAQLSDSNGNFTNPVVIGTRRDTVSGIIYARLPSTVYGHRFRIRVVSSAPRVISSDNGDDIVISPYKAPGIVKIGRDSLRSVAFPSYQWLLNNQPIAGANSVIYHALQSGAYRVVNRNTYYCFDTSAVFNLVISGIDEARAEAAAVEVYPNPSKGRVYLTSNADMQQITVCDMLGRQVYSRQSAGIEAELDIPAEGVYLIQIRTAQGSVTKRVIINH
jgi:uncharacterized delta-60 repeat protein